MKNLKTIVTSLLLLGVFTSQAQTKENLDGKLSKVTKKTFTFDKNGAKIGYDVTIQERREYLIKFDEADKGKIDQSRKDVPAMVTKLITVKSDIDSTYNRFIVLSYRKEPHDSFELVSTGKGFAVNVDNNTMEYIMGEGIYYAPTQDGDFFFVEEFDMIQ
ncbi:hypothetical protein LV716_02515 [Flagellimonas sp. HMM57]|uniref:hypothetical protein n=1 Tax=unclassified Flagellimonas TaxID=2644544 RepID=UPI0013D4D191|nr:MULTISPECIES: hypothetical protein [unclassified Flagellimonas]UII76679.1 hypothetical protein LV716_02515 [Flagellimonas sp. HMM57]